MNRSRYLLLFFLFLVACTASTRTADLPPPGNLPTGTGSATLSQFSGYPPALETKDPSYPAPFTQEAWPSPTAAHTSLPTGPIARLMLSGMDSEVVSISFSSRQHWLAAVTRETSTVSIWDYNSGELVRSISKVGSTGSDVPVVFQPGSTLLATGSVEGAVILWDAATGEQVLRLESPTGNWPVVFAFSPDGKQLAVGYYQALRIFDLDNSLSFQEIRSDFLVARLTSLSFSPDQRWLAIGQEHGPVMIWDLANDQVEKILPISYGTNHLAFSPDGAFLAATDLGSPAILWKSGEWTRYARIVGAGSSGGIGPPLAFSPDGRLMAVSEGNEYPYTASFWDTNRFEKVMALPSQTDWIRCLAFSPDGSLLATGFGDSSLVLWDVGSAAWLPEPRVSAPTAVPETLHYTFPQAPQAGQPVAFEQLMMIDAQHGWATAADGFYGRTHQKLQLLRTADGGLTWQVANLPKDLAWSFPMALDANRAWVVSAYEKHSQEGYATSYISMVTWRTVDGGATWQQSQPIRLAREGLSNAVSSFSASFQFFNHNSIGMQVLVDCDIARSCGWQYYRTADGGLNWMRLIDSEQQNNGNILHVLFWDADNAWGSGVGVAGWGSSQSWNAGIWTSADGGKNWQSLPLQPPDNLPEDFKNNSLDCAVYGMRRVSADAASLEVECIVYKGNSYPRYQFFYLTLDRGKTWHAWESNGTEKFISGSTGWRWLPGRPLEPSQLLQTTDSGMTWKVIVQLPWSGKLYFVSEQVGWVIARQGEAAALLRTEDGGKTWEELTPVIVP